MRGIKVYYNYTEIIYAYGTMRYKGIGDTRGGMNRC